MKSIFEQLREPMEYRWRVQSYSKSSPTASCVAYIDARDVQNLLDRVVGPENWQSDFYSVNNTMLCKLSIRVNGEWISKSDAGSESNIEKEKGQVSDCLKRAAVNFGIGRFLYEIPIKFVRTNEPKTDKNFPYAIDDKGNKIKDLTTFINGKKPGGVNNIVAFKKPNHQDKALKFLADRLKKASNNDEVRVIKNEFEFYCLNNQIDISYLEVLKVFKSYENKDLKTNI